MDEAIAKFRRLDAQKIIDTVQALHQRIEERFPGSGLGKVIAELLQVAEEAVERTRWIQRAHFPLRAAAVFLSLLIVLLLADLLLHIRQFQFSDFTNSVQALDSSISSVVFIGAAILFFLSWENRIKRRRSLKAIHELRALAHIVDMHQLTKDPETAVRGVTASLWGKRQMTVLDLRRYLHYCSDAMAVISKVAALYAQSFHDPILLDAVDDVEDLTAGFSRKIWQKITILESLQPSDDTPKTESRGLEPTRPAPLA